MVNPLHELAALGQSVWYDNIDRGQLQSGMFKSLLEQDGISGVTANPTIFDKSIGQGHAYDEQMEQLIREGKDRSDIYETMVISDIRTVADMLRPIYDHTNGADGYVSLEVSPDLAHDTEGTIKEVRRFWQMVDRPNLLVKDSCYAGRNPCYPAGAHRWHQRQHHAHLLASGLPRSG